MIKNIATDKLIPHPQNPRKNVGDITELAASINKNGIFQNLTVVPNEDDTYTIIIGHRRHAAAQEAGLTELPCAVVEMTEKEQLSTMLLENMQREDLTALEQAEGFQMMIDLGESVKSISEQTGFSQSTVRHRVKLLELDRNILEKQGREIPITAYIKLEKIQDVKRRNKVLKEIGTNNFDWVLNRTIEEEKNAKMKKHWVDYISQMGATDITGTENVWNNYQRVNWFNFTDKKKEILSKIPEEHFFYILSERYCSIYKEKPAVKSEPDDEETRARAEKEKKRQEVHSKLESLANMCRGSVVNFCHRFKSRSDADAQTIMRLFIFFLVNDGYIDYSPSSVIDDDLLEKWEKGEIDMTLSDIPTINDVPSTLLSLAIDAHADNYGSFYCFGVCNEFRESKELIAIYQSIKALGYEASDEELDYVNGTHELYAKNEEEE